MFNHLIGLELENSSAWARYQKGAVTLEHPIEGNYTREGWKNETASRSAVL